MIISQGLFKGQKIDTLIDSYKPCKGIVKNAIFNILSNIINFKDVSILDLFAGSGILSFEALSLGAKSAKLYDIDKKATNKIKENIYKLKLEKRMSVSCIDSKSITETDSDLIFIDPPYNKGLASYVLDNLKNKKAIFVVTTMKGEILECDSYKILTNRDYGKTNLKILCTYQI